MYKVEIMDRNTKEIAKCNVEDFFLSFKKRYNNLGNDFDKKHLICWTALYFVYGLDKLIKDYPPDNLEIVIDGLRKLADKLEKK